MHLDLAVVNKCSADSAGLKPPRNDKREAVWHPSASLRAGSEVAPFLKRTSEDARAYIDNGARAGRSQLHRWNFRGRGRSRHTASFVFWRTLRALNITPETNPPCAICV